ncbi:MAG: hypothetical protein ABIK92_16800 [Pseudomonadota bacterium]
MKNIILITILFFVLNSCATTYLWDRTDPNGYVKIKFTEITEDNLKSRGAKYIRDDNEHAFYVDKDSFDRFKDYSTRVLGTPITVVIDATTVVIFAVAFAITDNAIDDAREKGFKEDPDCIKRGRHSDY